MFTPNNLNTLIVFVKSPIPGNVKTRLADRVGDNKAAGLYMAMLEDLVQNVSHASLKIFYYIDDIGNAPLLFQDNSIHKSIREQRGNDLGEKMDNAISEVFAEGNQFVLLIGSDMPYLDNAILSDFFYMLRKYDMVIGPSVDGGYYCIGFRKEKYNSGIFCGIQWSTEHVYSETEKKANQYNLAVYKGPELRDIDTLSDLFLVIRDEKYNKNIPHTFDEAAGLMPEC